MGKLKTVHIDTTFGQLWEQTPDAVIAVSALDAVVHWNRAAEEIFGYSSGEAIGACVTDLIVPPDRNAEERRMLQQARTKGLAVYETINHRKDGSLVHVSVSVKMIKDEQGAPQYFLHTRKDTTQLQVLRDAKLIEAKFRDLLESTPDAIVMANVIGRIVLVNSQAEKVFGYTRAELIGEPVEVLLPERFRTTHIDHRSSFFRQPRARTMGAGLELYGRRKNTEEFPVEISLSPLVTEEGVMVMSAVRDITDRKKAEQKFRALLESAPDAMVIVGQDGRIILVNSQTQRLFGYQREELLGKSVEILVPQRFRDKHPGHRSGFFSQPRPRSMGAGLDLYGLRRDGTEFPVEVSLSPLETEEGMFVSSAIRDATDRKRFEHTLQQANRLKSEFLANMSHELRTPLNGIIGFSEFLADEKPGPLNAKQKEYLGDILSSGRHLLQLINDVLDLSKIEAGKMELFPQPFSLRKAIEDACALLSPLALTKNIQIKRQVSADLDEVVLDPQKFSQVLYNLLSNAVKFTDEGGLVEVAAARTPSGDFSLQVSDSGIGIKTQDFPRLFIEFQQLDASAARRYQGTGLGLALTKKIVEFQQGTISVTSEPGKGSVFTVAMPLPDPRAFSAQSSRIS